LWGVIQLLTTIKMGMKWIYRLKKEDFAHVAQRLNVALEGRLDDMRKALSEYYSVTQNDPQLVDIWAELEGQTIFACSYLNNGLAPCFGVHLLDTATCSKIMLS